MFGHASGLHHLRHRSHEPQVNQPLWDSRRTSDPKTFSHDKRTSLHPSLSLEITPLDVESPNVSPVGRRHLFSSVLTTHRSTPTTPSEESRYQKRLGESLAIPPFLDWREMTLTGLGSSDLSMNDSQNPISSMTRHDDGSSSGLEGRDSVNNHANMSAAITPPSTPTFLPHSLGSATLNFSSKAAVKDASGTRRMMLRRKTSSLRRSSSSSTASGENAAKVSHQV